MMKFLDDEEGRGQGVGRREAVLRAHAPRPAMSGAECSCGRGSPHGRNTGATSTGSSPRLPRQGGGHRERALADHLGDPYGRGVWDGRLNPASATMDCSTADAAGSPRSQTSANGGGIWPTRSWPSSPKCGRGIAVDVDPKLQTNRVADLGRTVRAVQPRGGVALLVALAVMSVLGAICAASGHGFDIFALLYILSGQWEFTGAQWALAGLLVILAGALAGLCWWLLARKVAPKVTGSADRTRADVRGRAWATAKPCPRSPGTGREDGVPSRQGLRPETHGAPAIRSAATSWTERP